MAAHSSRKHSKFSASGAERYFACPGSVALSEGLPDQESVYSLEGTRAHEVLEGILRVGIRSGRVKAPTHITAPREMILHGINAASFILHLHQKERGSEILVETRIALPFIHREMFGTFDGAVIDHFGTLHVFDYKYGAGIAVSPVENLQMIFYGMGLAAKYDWNFNRVRLWIIQPRIKGYDGPLYWELSILELMEYIVKFKNAVERAERQPDHYVKGPHCHFCKAKPICPLWEAAKVEKAQKAFSQFLTKPTKRK